MQFFLRHHYIRYHLCSWHNHLSLSHTYRHHQFDQYGDHSFNLISLQLLAFFIIISYDFHTHITRHHIYSIAGFYIACLFLLFDFDFDWIYHFVLHTQSDLGLHKSRAWCLWATEDSLFRATRAFRHNSWKPYFIATGMWKKHIKLIVHWVSTLGLCKLSRKAVSPSDLVKHYGDVIMTTIASQITSLTIVYPTFYWGADQSKHQSSASLAFVWGIQRGPVNSPHKGPVTRKMFPFDDVIMNSMSR